MKRATSAFFLLLGMVVPGQAAAIVQGRRRFGLRDGPRHGLSRLPLVT